MEMLSRLPLVLKLFQVFVSIVVFILVGIALDVAYFLGIILIFLCNFDGIDPSS